MQLQEIMQQLEQFGNEQTKRIFMNHGAKEPFFGVKVGDLKKIVSMGRVGKKRKTARC